MPNIVRLIMILCLLSRALDCHAQIRELGTGAPGTLMAPHLSAELISDGSQVAPGESARVALALQLEPGWHVYWINAGDSGQPPRVTWSLPSGVSVGSMQFPAPSRLPLGPLVDYGYEHEAVFPFALSVAKSAKTQHATLRAHVQWLVCREVCLPGKAFLGLDLEIVPGAHRVPNSRIEAAIKAEPQPLPSSDRVVATATRDHLRLAVATRHPEHSAEFYPDSDDQIRNAGEQRFHPNGQGGTLDLERSDPSDTLPKTIHGVLKLDDGRAYLFALPVQAVATSVSPASHTGVLGVLLLAFVGGMILNLMPCVFPVLFLKALSLVSSSGEEISSQRKHGAVYTVGILASFWSIVGVLLVLRRLGQHAGWGFQLQSPVFVVLMACLLFFMALSLAGMFDLGLTMTGTGDGLTRKPGYAGSFFTGVLATVVATPCTAPLMGAAIGFALSQSTLITFLVFTVLALGLAFPYALLTSVPSLANRLPKPGRWMETLKQFTAIPLLLTVVWLVWVYARLNGPSTGESSDHVARLLIALIVLAFAGWILGRWPARRWSQGMAVLVLVGAVAVPLGARSDQELEWQPYSSASMKQAVDSRRPVFVDFTAAWCLSCQVNERAVLQSDEVKNRLMAEHYVLLRADWTRYDPAITDALARAGRSGVPTYVVFSKTGEMHVLPEVLTRNLVLNAIQQPGVS